jgi:hypothetical protein
MATTQRDRIAMVLVCLALGLFAAAFLSYIYHWGNRLGELFVLGTSMDFHYWISLGRHHRKDCADGR